MPLSPGRLRQRITIRRDVRSPNGKGGFTTAWQDVGTVWAEVIGRTGREATIGEAIQGISVYQITIRYRDDILADDQIRYGSIDLNITSADDPDGGRESLLIIATTASARKTG